MKILLTGANGYIGRRLLPVLVKNGHHVLCLVRDPSRFQVPESFRSSIEVHKVDLLNSSDFDNLPTDIDAAYYLVHSMTGTSKDFSKLETTTAENFSNYINRTTARQVIYLGGISNEESLSRHLSSRKNVENVLHESSVPVTVLRAGIIVGSGSASFEIIRDLVEKLPVMVAPKWLNTKCQPIAIRNVIDYLVGVLGNSESFGNTYDIGGPDILTYKEMLTQFAEVRGYKRLIITLPVLTPRLSSYWLYFVTSTSFRLARSLVDSMKTEVICQIKGINKIVDTEVLNYRESVSRAFMKIEQNMVISSWKDAMITSSDDTSLREFVEVPVHGCFTDRKEVEIDREVDRVVENIWKIGGENGWYATNWLWRIRGFLDKVVGGVGLRRGRRSPTELNSGDALDFWRVLLASKSDRRLLLFAEMKLPGEAWLEFRIKNRDSQPRLVQTATFRPRGVLGRLYWYLMVPFHHIIFRRMARNIVHS